MVIRNIFLISLFILIAGCGLSSKDVISESKPVETAKIYVVSDRGVTYSNNNGQRWEESIQKSRKNNLASSEINDLKLAGSTLYISTLKGLSVSTDNFKTFVNFLPEKAINYLDLKDTSLLAASNTGCFLATKNYSFNLISAPSDCTKALFSGNQIFAAFQNNLMSVTLNSSEWQKKYTYPEIIKDFAINKDKVYVLTDSGLYLNARKIELGQAKTISALYFDSAKNLLWVATDFGLQKSSDEGNSWVTFDQSSGLDNLNISSIYVNNLNIYLTTNNGLIHSKNGGESWHTYKRQHGLLSNKLKKVIVKN